MTGDEREVALIEEIQQIVSQYKVEVPGHRKAWPKAVLGCRLRSDVQRVI